MNRDEILRRVMEVTADVLGCDPDEITEQSEFVNDLGAESIQSIELVAAYEVEFGIEMDEEEALHVQRVSDAVDFMAGYLD